MRHLSAVLIVGLLVSSTSFAQKHEHTEPVKKLEALYNSNAAFQQIVNEALDNVQPLPDGTANPWEGKDINGLYAFLNEWYYFLPNTEDGLDRIMEFSLLYYKNPYGLKMVREEPGLSWTKYFVEARGRYMDSEASLTNLNVWLESPQIKHDEFVAPIDGFKSFNEYFIRDLRPGARTIDAVTDDAVVVSPADCVLNMINNEITADTKIQLKGRMALSISELLAGSEYAQRFVGGTAMACFLLPDTYHHYHAPVSGTIVEAKEDVGDWYFGMDNLPGMVNQGNPGYNKDFSVFEQFRHGYFVIDTPGHGHVAMIPVGLNTIGSVVFEADLKQINANNATAIYKGDRLGRFQYGGSLVILVFEPSRLSAVKTRLGQQIGVMRD